MEYTITEIPAQKFLVMTKEFIDSADVPVFWDDCSENGKLGALLLRRPVGIRDLYGICRPAHDGMFEYGIGILLDVATDWMTQTEMDYCGYTIWDVPAGTYVTLDCYGDDSQSIAEAWKWFIEEFLPSYGYQLAESADYECYPDHEKDGVFCTLHIPVVKA